MKSFFRFLLRETRPKNIALAISLLLVAGLLLPDEIGKKMPVGSQSFFFVLIFLILVVAGFVFAVIEERMPELTQISAVFDQASSAVISLAVLLLPIYFIKPNLFGLMLLMFVVELGFVFGKFVYLRRTGQK